MSKYWYLKRLIFFSFLFSFFFFSNNYALSDTPKEDEYGLNTTATELPPEVLERSLGFLIGSVIKAILGFVGVLFVVLMIYAGVLWGTAKGNEQQSKKARDLIFWAIIGVTVVILAYYLVSFIGMTAMTVVN